MTEGFTINVLGKPYQVQLLEHYDIQENMGYAQRSQQRIALNKSNAPEQQEDTLLHEVIHIIDRELALGFDEATVQRLACGLHSAGYRRS